MSMTRRTFIKATLSAGVALSFPGGFVFPSRSRAQGKVREYHLFASRARISLGVGPEFWAWTYNGRVPGPEIRVKEGEVIRVILKNYLPEETTIHWHGVPVPNPMDGVPDVTQKGIAPGESFVYEFEARPAGTYLYHSHAKYQLDQGLYGPLIIEPAGTAGGYDREYTLMLEDWVMRDEGGVSAPRRRAAFMGMGMMGRRRGTMTSRDPLLEPGYDGYAVNGRVYPEVAPMTVSQGDKVKLRLLNPSSATIYTLSMAGHRMTITHTDGRPIKPVETDVLRIGMGERYDVEFVANNPGYWLLAAMEQGLGEGGLRIPIRYKGILSKEPVGPRFDPGLRFVSYGDLRSLGTDDTPSPEAPERFYSQVLSGGMHSPYWTINGQVYPEADPLPVTKGERTRIGYWNRSMKPHPMHLHGHFFHVVNPDAPRETWIQKDTVIVNPMERVEVELLADNPGKWFHHCHNLYHMMAGMANVMVVSEPSTSGGGRG
jgi:FtsP/CotA-like multicopper oxidase with cupredoxin domain